MRPQKHRVISMCCCARYLSCDAGCGAQASAQNSESLEQIQIQSIDNANKGSSRHIQEGGPCLLERMDLVLGALWGRGAVRARTDEQHRHAHTHTHTHTRCDQSNRPWQQRFLQHAHTQMRYDRARPCGSPPRSPARPLTAQQTCSRTTSKRRSTAPI